jgi:pyrroline-5-carboxylate reductase
MKVTIVGGGSMGEVILSAVISKCVCRPEFITVSRRSTDHLARLRKKYGVNVTSDNLAAIANADVVILSIKPQSLVEVMAGLNGFFKHSQLLLSIIAGARIHTPRPKSVKVSQCGLPR